MRETLDPLGHRSTVEYDDHGNPTVRKSFGADGVLLAESAAVYDLLGRLTEAKKWLWETDAAGGERPVEARPLLTRLEYDAASNLIRGTDPLDRVSENRYDAAERLRETEDAVGNRRLRIYDRGSNVVEQLDVELDAGGTSVTVSATAAYDALGRQVSRSDALNNTTEFQLDARGLTRLVIDPEGYFTQSVYDGLDRQVRETRPEGIRVDREYDKSSRLVSYRDALGHETTWDYDAANRRTRVTYPDAHRETYAYDASHNLTRRVDQRGTTVSQSYDAAGRLTDRSVVAAEGEELEGPFAETYAYDGLNRPTRLQSGAVVTEFAYDSLSRRISDRSDGWQVSYGFDDAGNTTRTTYPSSHEVNRTFDALDRPSAIANGASQVAQYGYRGRFLVQTKTLGNGLVGRSTFDPARRVTEEVYTADGKSPAFQESAAWSPRDLKIGQSRRDQNHQGLAFAYDGAGRLTEAARPPRPLDGVANNSVADPARLEGVEDTTKFEYDAAHNLLEVTRLESGVAHQEEAPIDSSGRNRPASIGGIPLQWDANGNLVEKGDVRFHYDYRNRLARVSGAEGDLVTFTYDALGRRVRKNSGGVVVKEVWDGWQSIEEYRNGQLAQRRVYGGDLDEVVHTAVDLNGDGVPERTYVPLYDSSGHLALTTDDSGKPIERYEYGAFGNPRVEPGRMILADESPPFVEQLRIFEGALLLEVSEEVLSDRLSEAASAGDLRLVGTQSGEVIPFSVAQPIASGAQARRRIVVTPGTLPVAGTEVTLTVGSRALQDLFHNTAASDFAQTFSWPAADALLYDGAAPRVGLVAVRAGILEIELTEEPDLAAAQSLITVNGAATPWTLGPDRYTLIATSALAEGSHELAIAMGALDLAGSGLAETFNATVPVAAAEPESIVFRAQDPREIAGSAIGNRFGFHGLPGEEEVRLLYVRNRYYDPELGRFITPDPMGYKDGPNPYQYALNDPANHHDPMGLNKGRIDGKKNEKSGNENADIRDKIARITELKSRLAALKKKIAKREFELALRIAVFGMEDQEARETLGGILRGFGFLVSDVTSVMSAILGPAGNCGDAVGQINCRLAKTAPAVRSMEWVVSTSAMMFITSGTMLGFLDDVVNPAVWGGARWTVDPRVQAADEAAGVLVNGRYIRNPTIRYLRDLLTDTGKIGSKRMSGQFMYAVDKSGKIIIGTRAGQRMPHPTLVGGAIPQVRAAGIVDIRGGRIYSVNNASGHFRPSLGSLQAEEAFSQLPGGAFHKQFQGYVPFQ